MSDAMNRNPSFQRRVVSMILILIGVVFVAIIIAFNLYIASFIKSDAVTQINIFANYYDKEKTEHDSLPDTASQPKNRTGTRAEVFIISSEYAVQNFHESEDGDNTQRVQQIASYLQDQRIDLTSIRNMHVRIGAQEYYLTAVKDTKQENSFVLFYVDITTISQFSSSINLVLIIIMLAAALISVGIAVIIANAVNRPVKQLIHFARQIGKGDFSKKELTFPDREFTELAATLNQTAQQLGKYDSEQRIFFQNVSHEFRTPLMSIKCYAEGIECGLMDQQKSSRIILTEVDRLSEMVEDLLYLSRIDNMTSEIEKQEGDLRETFGACAEGLMSIADKENIRFVYEFDEEPVCFLYNEKYMSRAFNNLLTNALRYAKSQICLSCKTSGGVIRLSVTDDGDGISADDLPHIFERFYKGKNGNHGIGLSIVKSVVQLHGGNISVSHVNGTSFVIEFGNAG